METFRDMQRGMKWRVRRSHHYGQRDHGDHTLRNRKRRRHVKEDDSNFNRDSDSQRDKNKRVSRGHKYGHRDYGDHDHNTHRHRKHERKLKEDDIHREIGRQQHNVGAKGKKFSQESYYDPKDLLRLEKLFHDLKEDDDSPPSPPSSTDSDIVVEWTSLPRDAVFCILDKLLDAIDHVRFAVVSKEWGAVAKYYNHTTQRWIKQENPLPMLMIPTGTEGEQKLYSVTERRIYDHIRLPVPYNDKCYGCNYGWLATLDRSLEEIWISDLRKSPYAHEVMVVTYRITLHNPFGEGTEVIQLPPLKYSFLKKEEQYTYIVPHVILSADPTLHPENYVVLAFCNHFVPLAFIKGGQKDWVQFKSPYVHGNDRYFSAIFYRNQIYAITAYGSVMMKADVSGSSASPPERILKLSDRTKWGSVESYLVESTTGDLLCVRRYFEYVREEDGGKWLSIERFRVYKMVFSEENDFTYDMLEMENIGDEAIFLVQTHSICVSASKFPGCQPNSIYHTTDDYRKLYFTNGPPTMRDCEMGVYDLDHKVTTPLYSSEDERNWNNYMPHWVVLPSFKGLVS